MVSLKFGKFGFYCSMFHEKYGFIVGNGATHMEAISNALILLANKLIIV